jgi:phosphinothricin acetyltransferase
MKIRFDRMAEGDREAVVDIFNYYIENSFAAYIPRRRCPMHSSTVFLELTQGYPALTARDEKNGGRVVGFAFLRPYHPVPSFLRAAEFTCFIEPGYTGRGIGSDLLNRIVAGARNMGVDTILANISSLNEASLRIHGRHGFEECGRFRRVASKRGRDLDAVWMQRIL